jgi:hypothetical protein
MQLILSMVLLVLSNATQGNARTIHVFVALCDNEHQGIVPVPKQLGNGEDPANNLYWGALYGTRTVLKKSPDWTVVTSEKNPSAAILERVVFRHKTTNVYLVADAYQGARIKVAIEDFLNAAAGNNHKTLQVGGSTLGVCGAADLIAYVGHNGLMDFDVNQPAPNKDARSKAAMVLACRSEPYFHSRLKQLKCRPVLLTTGFMAPEGYVLEAAVNGWLAGEKSELIRDRVARAYDKYQKCGLTAARRLFYSGE